MARQTRNSARRGSTSRRKTAWSREGFFDNSGVVGTVKFDLLSDYKSLRGVDRHVPGLTIGGGFLQWSFVADTSSLTGGIPVAVRCGIIVVDAEMTSEVPDPQTHKHADWMWWQEAYVSLGSPQVRFDGSESPMLRWKARRRMDEAGMRLWIIFGFDTPGQLSGAASTLLYVG